MIEFIVGLSFLIVLSVLDFWTFNKEKGYIPAVLTTMFLIVSFLIGSHYYSITIALGVLGALIGLLFTDLDLWDGIADYKIFIACSMLMPSMTNLLMFGLSLTIIAFLTKGYYRFVEKSERQIPFIPLILIAFLVSGGLIW